MKQNKNHHLDSSDILNEAGKKHLVQRLGGRVNGINSLGKLLIFGVVAIVLGTSLLVYYIDSTQGSFVPSIQLDNSSLPTLASPVKG